MGWTDFLDKTSDSLADAGGSFLQGLVTERFETKSASAPIILQGAPAPVYAVRSDEEDEVRAQQPTWIPGVSNMIVIAGAAAVGLVGLILIMKR